MSLLRRLGFDTGDERSVLIALYSGRITWLFTAIVLLVWSLHNLVRTGTLSIAFVVLAASQTVFWGSQLYYSRKLGG